MTHQLRLKLIAGALALVVVALVAGGALGASIEVMTGLLGALGVLVPALVDANSVEKRRRDPKRTALPDDVLGARDPDPSREERLTPDR